VYFSHCIPQHDGQGDAYYERVKQHDDKIILYSDTLRRDFSMYQGNFNQIPQWY